MPLSCRTSHGSLPHLAVSPPGRGMLQGPKLWPNAAPPSMASHFDQIHGKILSAWGTAGTVITSRPSGHESSCLVCMQLLNLLAHVGLGVVARLQQVCASSSMGPAFSLPHVVQGTHIPQLVARIPQINTHTVCILPPAVALLDSPQRHLTSLPCPYPIRVERNTASLLL